MGKAIVIYTSKRGSTKQYAEWIAEDLGCPALTLDEAKSQDINLYEYDCIIYGGWIRGSGIVDFDKFAKWLDDELMIKTYRMEYNIRARLRAYQLFVTLW